jgi:hypothetical protein
MIARVFKIAAFVYLDDKRKRRKKEKEEEEEEIKGENKHIKMVK